MQYLIKYYYIKSDHVLATPEFDNEEIIEANTIKDLDSYIKKQKDQYGHPFKKKKSFGFNYISTFGGVKVSIYNQPIIKKVS